MRRTRMLTLASAVLLAAIVAQASAADGLKEGSVELQSAGPIAFGPQGILLVGDPKAATIYAIETNDTSGNAAEAKVNVEGLSEKIAQALKADAASVQVADLAVNPTSGNVYLSVNRGGPDAAALVKVTTDGKVSQIGLDSVRCSKAVLADAPEDKVTGEGRRARNMRMESITDVAFMDGTVIVSGLSKADAPSSIRTLAFPFDEAAPGTSIEIYHGAHGKLEDYAAVRTFVHFNIDGEPTVLAAYTCTPLVKFPVKDLVPGEKVRGTTVAELGNRNRPYDIITYKKDGKEYLLMANSARGVMKISTDAIGKNAGINEPVRGGGIAGQSYDTIEDMKGVVQLDKLNDTHAVILVQADSGALNLHTIDLP